MKYILSFILLCSLLSVNAQFTGTDSLRNYNNRFITNDPMRAFTNNRLHNLIGGIIDFLDSASGGGSVSLGVDTMYVTADSIFHYKKNGVFRSFVIRGNVGAGKLYEIPFSDGLGRFSNDSNFKFDVSQGANNMRLIVGPTAINDGGLSKLNATSDNMNAAAFTAFGTGLNTIVFRRALGSVGLPLAITAGTDLWNFSGRGYTGTFFTTSRAAIYAQASQDWTDTTHGTRVYIATTTNDSLIMRTRMIIGDSVEMVTLSGATADSIAGWRYNANGLSTLIKIPKPSKQTLQQVFNEGSTLTKHDTIFQGRNVLALDGQFIVKDTNRVGESQSILIFGTSVDVGLIPPFTFLATRWGSQVAGNLGLTEWNRAISGTTLMHHASNDSCMFDRLYTIPNWDQSIRYIVIGTYPLNDVIYQDSSTYRTGLSAMIDSLHVNRGYPLQSIIILNGSPAPVRSSTLGLIATASIHVAMEKGTRYFDSYNYLSGDLGNTYSDDLHLSLKGQINLAYGLLNSTTFDSVTYIMANSLQVQKGLTNNGFLVTRGYAHIGKDLTVDGNIDLVGTFTDSARFLKGISINGDAVFNRQWNLFYDPGFNEKWGIMQGGSGPYHTYVYASGASGSNQVMLGVMSTSNVFSPTLAAGLNLTKVYSTGFEVQGTTTLTGATTLQSSLQVVGNTTTGQEWNLYKDATFNEMWGIRMGGSNPYFTDLYCSYGSASHGVRLGWVSSNGTTYNSVLTALKGGNVLIGTSTDNAIGKLQVNGKVTIATIDSTTTSNNLLYQEPTTGEVKKTAYPILKGSTTWQPGVVAANSSTTTTLTITGAVSTDVVHVNKVTGGYSNGEIYDAWVSSPNTITLRVHNVSSGSANYNTTETYNVILLKY